MKTATVIIITLSSLVLNTAAVAEPYAELPWNQAAIANLPAPNYIDSQAVTLALNSHAESVAKTGSAGGECSAMCPLPGEVDDQIQ